MVGGKNSHLESNPVPARDAQRAQTLRGLTLCAPGPRDPTEPETELCLSTSFGGTGQLWTATETGSGFSRHGYGISPLGGASRPYTGLGNRLFEGTRTQEKGAATTQETDPELPVSVQESPAEAWVGGGLRQCWGP